MNMTTHAFALQRVLIDGFTFDPVVPGSYLRSQVTYEEPFLDTDRLHAAYLKWCESTGATPEWTITPKNDEEPACLDVGLWAVYHVDASGRLRDAELSRSSYDLGLSQNDAIVQLHLIGIDEFEQHYFITSPNDTNGVDGVLEILHPVDITLLQATFAQAGLGTEYDCDLDVGEFRTTLDIVQHPDGRAYNGETDDAVLVSHASFTMRDEAHAALAVDELLKQQLHNLNAMNDIAEVPAVQASASDAAPIFTTTAIVSPAADPVAADIHELIAVPAYVPPQQHSAEPISAPGFTSVETASDIVSTQPDSALIPTDAPSLDVEHFGKHGANVSRLLEAGVGGLAKPRRPDRPKRERQDRPVNVPPGTKIPSVQRNASAQKLFSDFAQKVESSRLKPENDGIDHINCSGGRTQLGKALDPNANVGFTLPELGHFESIGALWVYLRCDDADRNDNMRSLHGTRARHFAKRYAGREFDGFRQMIADATWMKVNTWPDLVRDVVGSDLPFAMYHVSDLGDGKKEVTDNGIAFWYARVLTEVARTLKEIASSGDNSLVPDFSFVDPDLLARQRQERRDREQRQTQRRDGRGNGGYYGGAPSNDAGGERRPNRRGSSKGAAR